MFHVFIIPIWPHFTLTNCLHPSTVQTKVIVWSRLNSSWLGAVATSGRRPSKWDLSWAWRFLGSDPCGWDWWDGLYKTYRYVYYIIYIYIYIIYYIVYIYESCNVLYHFSCRGCGMRDSYEKVPSPSQRQSSSCPSSVFIAFTSWIWHMGGTQVPRSLHLLHSRKSEGIHIVPHCSGNLTEMFWGQLRCTMGHQAIKSLLQHHWLVRIKTCISKIHFSLCSFHWFSWPSLDSDSARSWIRDFSKFHPESSSNSASSQPASGGHRDVKCLQRGVGGWLVVANGPVGKSMASRRMYGPLSLYEHHDREHHALAWPSCPMMLRIQWCSCLKVLSSSTLLLSLFWWSWISLFSLVFAMDFATLAGHWRDICVPLFCLWHSGDSLHAIPGQSLCRLPAWLAWLGALKKG